MTVVDDRSVAVCSLLFEASPEVGDSLWPRSERELVEPECDDTEQFGLDPLREDDWLRRAGALEGVEKLRCRDLLPAVLDQCAVRGQRHKNGGSRSDDDCDVVAHRFRAYGVGMSWSASLTEEAPVFGHDEPRLTKAEAQSPHPAPPDRELPSCRS